MAAGRVQVLWARAGSVGTGQPPRLALPPWIDLIAGAGHETGGGQRVETVMASSQQSMTVFRSV